MTFTERMAQEFWRLEAQYRAHEKFNQWRSGTIERPFAKPTRDHGYTMATMADKAFGMYSERLQAGVQFEIH